MAFLSNTSQAQTAPAANDTGSSLPGVSLAVWPSEPIDATNISPGFPIPGGMIAYGDSITHCAKLTDLSQCFVHRLASYFGIATIQDFGLTGNLACDVVRKQVFVHDSPVLSAGQPLRTLMIGTNDSTYKALRYYASQFNLCHQAMLSWLGTPIESKVLGSSVVSGASGSCVIDETNAAAYGILCNSPGAAVSFSLTTTGKPIYIWYRIIDGDTGTYTGSVDGGPPATLTTALSKPIYMSGHVSDSIALLRIPTSAGTHEIRFVQVKPGSMAIIAAGTPSDAPEQQLPYVLVADVPQQLDGGNQDAVDGYGALIRANIQLLADDGLNLKYAPVSKYLLATTAAGDMGDKVHPNSVGHLEVFNAFLSQAEQLAPPSFGPHSRLSYFAAVVGAPGSAKPTGSMKFFVDSIPMGQATVSDRMVAFTASLPLPVGNHVLTASFASDTGASTVSSQALESTITGQPTLTELVIPQPAMLFGTPVKLVAKAFSNGARLVNGTVAFLDEEGALGVGILNSQGFAALTLPSFPVGQHYLQAEFMTEGNLGTSFSPSTPLLITPIKTFTTLAITPGSALVGTNVSLTASVVSNGLPVTTGSVTFSCANRALGSAMLNPAGIATLEISSLDAGKYAVKGEYVPQGNYRQSISASVSLLIQETPDFTLAVVTNPLTVTRGKTATTALLVTPIHGFRSMLHYAVGGLPTGTSAHFDNPSVQANGQILIPVSITASSSTTEQTLGNLTKIVTFAAVSSPSLKHLVPMALTILQEGPP